MSNLGVGAFPIDDYTPYGYLNLPGHTRRLTPRGVMRSHGVGFRWHFPSLAAQYGGRRERYRAGLRLAEVEPGQTTVPYHSSNLLTFELGQNPGGLSASWFMINDDCLCGRFESAAGTPIELRADYERIVSADGEWGESGLVGRLDGDDVVLQSFEDGDAFVIRGHGGALTAAFDRGEAPCTVLGDHQDQVELRVRLSLTGSSDVSWVVMVRGRTVDSAKAQLPQLTDLQQALDARIAADKGFWANAPVLEGDWPEHWRRGVVYDQETLRMMVKAPVGIYQHTWDAMQIHAPRTVLGEAAMDALALSWADPKLAAELLLGTFADAPLPNVPCSREDGTYNMVSADGTVCGTGPQWGYPFLVAERLAGAFDSEAWIAEIYPYLAAFLDWWLEHRRDAEGWLVHACSWESGQDLSPRFLEQPLGGGHPTWQIRPVDLHASAAHAAGVLVGFAQSVATEDVDRWQAIEEELVGLTQRLWDQDHFADVDGSTGNPTGVDDIMLLSPLALGVATSEQTAAAQNSLLATDPAELVWPMFVWTPVLAAQHSGRPEVAADLASAIIDRAYRYWDSRVYDGTTTMPGIACEYWPLHGRCGGEGYGWGAFTLELLMSAVVGLRINDHGVTLCPQLPADLRQIGTQFAVSFSTAGGRHRLVLEPLDHDRVRVSGLGVTREITWGEQVIIDRDELA